VKIIHRKHNGKGDSILALLIAESEFHGHVLAAVAVSTEVSEGQSQNDKFKIVGGSID
jgi:hypothetical protein